MRALDVITRRRTAGESGSGVGPRGVGSLVFRPDQPQHLVQQRVSGDSLQLKGTSDVVRHRGSGSHTGVAVRIDVGVFKEAALALAHDATLCGGECRIRDSQSTERRQEFWPCRFDMPSIGDACAKEMVRESCRPSQRAIPPQRLSLRPLLLRPLARLVLRWCVYSSRIQRCASRNSTLIGPCSRPASLRRSHPVLPGCAVAQRLPFAPGALVRRRSPALE